MSALKVRVLDLGLSPYADFALFVNFQHRFAKSLKFKNYDGSFRTVEVPGPPNYDSWLASWNVFDNARPTKSDGRSSSGQAEELLCVTRRSTQ